MKWGESEFPGSVAETLSSQCGSLDLIPGQGTRSYMLQLSLHAATKDSACCNLAQPGYISKSKN